MTLGVSRRRIRGIAGANVRTRSSGPFRNGRRRSDHVGEFHCRTIAEQARRGRSADSTAGEFLSRSVGPNRREISLSNIGRMDAKNRQPGCDRSGPTGDRPATRFTGIGHSEIRGLPFTLCFLIATISTGLHAVEFSDWKDRSRPRGKGCHGAETDHHSRR